MDNKGIRGEIAKYQRFQNNDALKIELTLKIVGAINAKECLDVFNGRVKIYLGE